MPEIPKLPDCQPIPVDMSVDPGYRYNLFTKLQPIHQGALKKAIEGGLTSDKVDQLLEEGQVSDRADCLVEQVVRGEITLEQMVAQYHSILDGLLKPFALPEGAGVDQPE